MNWVVDAVRVATIAGAFWVIVLIVRVHALCALHGKPMNRQRAGGLFMDLGYALLLAVTIVHRYQAVGTPPDWTTWADAAVVALGMVGMGVRFEWHWPFRQQRADTRNKIDCP